MINGLCYTEHRNNYSLLVKCRTSPEKKHITSISVRHLDFNTKDDPRVIQLQETRLWVNCTQMSLCYQSSIVWYRSKGLAEKVTITIRYRFGRKHTNDQTEKDVECGHLYLLRHLDNVDGVGKYRKIYQ